MECENPIWVKRREVPCGVCYSCRYNRARHWTGRIIFQSIMRPGVVSLTLTYSDSNLNFIVDKTDWSVSFATLKIRDYQLFLKRFRKLIKVPIQYYICGEYGEKTERPHYHVLLWGVPHHDTLIPGTLYKLADLKRNVDYPDLAKDLLRCWQLGNIHCATFTPQFAAYCAKHTTKFNYAIDPDALGVRLPQFARMSLKPAIGDVPHGQVHPLIDFCFSDYGSRYILQHGDVPNIFRFDGQFYPIGRYLVNKMRVAVGMEPKQPVQIQIDKQQAYLDLSSEERLEFFRLKSAKRHRDARRAERLVKRHLR